MAQSAMGLSRLRLTTFLLSDAAFSVFIANTDLLSRCQGKMFLHNSRRFDAIYCKTVLQRLCQVVLTSQSSMSLDFVPTNLFHISIMCSMFDILWRQVCGLQVSGDFDWPVIASGKNAQESHLHTGLKDCRRSSHDGRFLLAIIMMTQGDGAKLFKACSTRTHMGGAQGFFNLIMLWRCQ